MACPGGRRSCRDAGCRPRRFTRGDPRASQFPTAFWFRLPNDGTVAVARTLEEFDRAVASVPTASLQHHVGGGDFSRWAREVLGDADLAAGLAKVGATGATGVPVDRDELRRHLHARCVV